MINYAIIRATEIPKLDFTQLCNDSAKSLTYNNDKTLAIVKFKGKLPKTLHGLKLKVVNGNTVHTQQEIRAIITNPANGWVMIQK